jgi:endo-1,3-1,4-beta-glycanase ExoK
VRRWDRAAPWSRRAAVLSVLIVATACARPAPTAPAALPSTVETARATPTAPAAPAASAPAASAPAASAPVPGPTVVPRPAPSSASRAAAGPIAVENFDGTGLDASRWKVYDAPATNGVSRWSPDMVRVTGGELQITGAGRDPTGSANVSGGLCWCRGDGARTYGRWQIRARFEAGTGYGQAILLWPTSERWPDDGEIDIVETPTATKRTADGTVHWGTSARPEEDSNRITGDFTAWHTYTVDWRPGSVKLYVDETLLYDSTSGSHPPTVPSTPMSLALQQEPGPFGTNWVPAPTAATPDRVVMHIDWITLYP